MGKILAITNVVVGLLAFSLQISTLVIYKDVGWGPDKAGFFCNWGGIYLVIFGLLLIVKKLKSSQIVFCMAIMAALIGVIFIGLASWSLNVYQRSIAYCDAFIPLRRSKTCVRAVIDSLMIVSGILALIVNAIIAGSVYGK